MIRYYRDVADPAALLRRERDPVTGARVDPPSSKHDGRPSTPSEEDRPTTRRRARRRVVGLVSAVALLVGGGVAWAARQGSQSSTALSADSTLGPVDVTEPMEEAETTLVPVVSAAPVVAQPIVAPATTVPVALPLVVASGYIENTPQVITYESGVSSTFSGSFPISVQLRCTTSGCVYPLRDNQPGAVTADGSVLIDVVDGRIQSTTSAVRTCRGNQGTVFSRTVATTLDLLFADAEVRNGIAFPSLVTGTITMEMPASGFTPSLPRVDDGQEIGCYRQTIVIPISAELTPSA